MDDFRSTIGRERTPLRLGVELAAAGVLLILVRDVLLGALGLLTWVVLAALIAVSLDPVIDAVQRRLRCGRGVAVAVVGSIVLAVVVFVVSYLGPRALRQAERFSTELPLVTQRLTELPFIGSKLAKADVPHKVNEWLEKLPASLGNDAQPLVTGLRAVVNGVTITTSAVVLVVCFLLDGPAVVSRLRTGMSPAARGRLDRALPVAQRIIGRYFVGSVVVALLTATVTLATGLALTIPLAPVAAGWIAVTNLIPQIGGFLGGSVFVTLGFLDGPRSGTICLIVFLVWQQIENHIVSPLVVGEAVDLSPPITLVAALVGASTFGVLGALLAIPLTGVAKALALETAVVRGRMGRSREGGADGPATDEVPEAEPGPPEPIPGAGVSDAGA